MLNEQSICEKYAEFIDLYKDEGIDDFETFVRARVVDYFINSEHLPADEVFETVNSVLSGFDSDTSVSGSESDFSDEEDGEEVPEQAQNNGDNETRKNPMPDLICKCRSDGMKKVLPILCVAAAVAGALCITYWYIEKKRGR